LKVAYVPLYIPKIKSYSFQTAKIVTQFYQKKRLQEELNNIIDEVKGLTALLNSFRFAEEEGGAHVYGKEALMILETMSHNIVKRLEAFNEAKS